MIDQVVEKIQHIEAEAKQIEQEYQKQASEIIASGDSQIRAMQDDVTEQIEQFESYLKEKNDEKIAQHHSEIAQAQAKEIAHIEQLYNDHKKEYVQAIIKEVFKQYGDS